MKIHKFGIALALVLAIFSLKAFATCDEQLEDSFYTSGIATRGYLDNTSLDDPKGYDLAKQGLIGWGLAIYLKPSIEAAKAHFDLVEAEQRLAKFKTELEQAKDPEQKKVLDNLVKKGEEFLKTGINRDPLSKGAYLIADVPEDFEALPMDQKMNIYKEAFAKAKFIYFDRLTGEPIAITEEGKKKINVDKAVVANLGMAGFALYNYGWVFPQIRGALKLDKENLGGSTYRNLNNQARKFAGKGYTVRFNYNFHRSLEMVRDQRRVGQSIEENRYKNPSVFNAALKSYEAGRAFSVEMVDVNGNIKGGLICFRYGNIVAINTVFYEPPNVGDLDLSQKTPEEQKTILEKPYVPFAKLPVLALIKRLQDTSVIEFIDMGMVSPRTLSL